MAHPLRMALSALALTTATTLTSWAEKPTEPHVFSVPQSDGVSFVGHPEYRVRHLHIEPLEVNGSRVTTVDWVEQRLRLDVTMAYGGWVAVHVQTDLLDGVLFGDNGTFGVSPTVNSGLGIASKQPNLSTWSLGLLDGGDPLSTDGYGPVLKPVQPIRINYAYGEVILPFGLFRAGRMPISDGGDIGIHDGRSGRNRWGASWYHNASDRLLFATKLSEAFELLSDSDHVVDTSLDRGLFMGIVYDFLVMDEVLSANDDLSHVAVQLSWRMKDFDFLGLEWDWLRLDAALSYRWEQRYQTRVFAIPMYFGFKVGDVQLDSWCTVVTGATRELSAGFAELTGDDVVLQRIDQVGARVQLTGKLGDFTLVGEWAYGTGDADPRPETPQSSFSWARDTNLGMLLFEHIVAFQSARSAAVGIENLQQLEAESFPLTEIATEGRAGNINAFFPQIFYDPVAELRLKLGVLFAWAQSPIVDPIQTILALDGANVADDALNYHGGKPGSYWGTELDLGIEYRYRDFFDLVLEAAVVFPGDGLHDENGEAVTSWMVETRLVFSL